MRACGRPASLVLALITCIPLCLPLDHLLVQQLEKSDKLVLYASYVSELSDMLASGSPLIFSLTNEAIGGKVTHVGVLEFSGDQHGVAYVPAW